jgi:hypothetical protein
MREKNRWYLLLVACLLFAQAAVTYAAPPETVTLQGVVESSSGDPVSGIAAYRLRFYDAETGGSQLGSDVTGTTTLSSRGRFSIELTPPAAVISASSAWYEIALDATTPGDGVDADDVFQARIKLTSVPFALQTSDSNNLNSQDGNYYTNASNLDAGTVAEPRIDAAIARDSEIMTTVFASDGAGSGLDADLLDGLDVSYFTDASNLASGNLGVGRMPAGGAWTLSSDLNVDSDTLVVDQSNNRVGIGIASPLHTLHVNGNISATMVDTGQGNNELYAMNQDVQTTSNVIFNTIHVSDYGYALGGFHVGGAGDPGTDNLVVDGNVVGTGNLTIDGNVVVGSYDPLTAKLRVYQTNSTNVKVVHSTIFYNGCDDTAWLFSGERFNGDTWVDTEFKVTGLGKCYADGGWNAAADYAEYFYTENLSISEGDLVSIVEKDYRAEFDAMGEIERASMFNSQDTLGIVSTNPGVTGILVPDTTEDSQVIESDPHYKTVGLLGQVPAKVLFTNEVLSSGDPIAPSCLAGIGMKATQPGQIVAKALEGFDMSGAIDVASLDDIDWPEDDGTNPAKPCFRVPISSFGSEIQEALATDHGLQPSDHIYVGKIMVFVNVSWYDPDPDAGALERKRLAAENRVLQTDISTLHDRLERLEAMLGVSNDTH